MEALRTVVLTVLVCLIACSPAASIKLDPKVHDCADATSCERAIEKAAPGALPKLLASYTAATGNPGWQELYAALTATGVKVPFVGATGAIASADAADAVRPLPLPPETTAVPRDRLLLALGRAAGRPHILLRDEDGARQLFPLDALAPHMLGVPAVVALAAGDIPAALALARDTRELLRHASAFDYVSAARDGERLRARAASAPHADEGAMRARLALWLLDSAGIALAADANTPPAPFPERMSTPYADLLAVQLSRPHHAEAWAARGKRISAGMTAERVRTLASLYAPADACPAPLAPPIEHPSDVAFAGLLALALDDSASPDAPPAEGKLSMTSWLERYDTLVRHVEQSGSAWAALGSLLRQRGELLGLTAEGTGAYKRVTDLTLKHVASLTQLAEAEPSRFQTLAVVSLVYQPGVLSDARLRTAVAELVGRSVELKIAQAPDTATLFDAALAAFAAGMSFPVQLQKAQFDALSSALEAKLASSFGASTGWPMAGLHLGNAALSALLGEEGALSVGAERMAKSLDGDVDQRSLARLAISTASYARLSAKVELDATVENPAMFTEPRKRAREALGEALATLAAPGPRTAPEKQLHREITELADLLVAAVVSHLQGDSGGPQCAGEGAIGAQSKLRSAFDRLRKKREAMVEGHAFDKAAGLWPRRARLVALLLSDIIDWVDQRGGQLSFTIPTSRAAGIVDQALDGWLDHAGAELTSGIYLLARSGLSPGSTDVGIRGAVRALTALGKLFADEKGSLFATLAKLGAEAGSTSAKDVGALVSGYARRAYAAGVPDHGDLLLMVRLAVAVVRDRDVAQRAIDLAKAHGRAVYLPLLMYGPRDHKSSAALRAAMTSATQRGCQPPSPAAVLAVERAIADFKRGERDAAIRGLGKLLDDADELGLVVPRQVFRFEQHQGKKVFNAEQSVSFGNRLLRGASAFQLGLGFQSRDAHSGSMTVTFADPKSAPSGEEAARYYAHAAALRASYAFVLGRETDAVRAARRAVGVWVNGARLGDRRIFVGNKTASWARDATATLIVAGQQAADAGLIFLASDLWTLAKAGLDPGADDDAIASLLDPLPEALRGIDELKPVVARARDNLTILAMKLPCTKKAGKVADHVRVRCGRYPTSLALRATDSLEVLPRLKKAGSQGPACGAYRKLDGFLAAADQGRYEPKQLVAAVAALRDGERLHDAASVLARHRHPDHCNPKLVTLARQLAARTELGQHLRADLLSVATNCAPADQVEEDLLALDAITQTHALPTRNFEALLFATRLALKHNTWSPLAEMSSRDGFIRRYNALGPDFGAAALLVNHAAAIGAGRAVDMKATLPFYRLLCTTFPPKERSATCHAVSIIRDSGANADKKRAAAKALADFLQRGAQAMRPQQ